MLASKSPRLKKYPSIIGNGKNYIDNGDIFPRKLGPEKRTVLPHTPFHGKSPPFGTRANNFPIGGSGRQAYPNMLIILFACGVDIRHLLTAYSYL